MRTSSRAERDGKTCRLTAAASLVLFATAANLARADVPMALLFGYGRIMLWWATLLGLLVELVAIRRFLLPSFPTAVLATLIVNAATVALGLVGYSRVTQFLYYVIDPGATVDMVASALLFGSMDTAVELALLMAVFSARPSWAGITSFFIANLASAGIVLAALFSPLAQGPGPIPAEDISYIEETFSDELEFMERMRTDLMGDDLATRTSIDPQWIAQQRTEAESLRFRELKIILGYFETSRSEERTETVFYLVEDTSAARQRYETEGRRLSDDTRWSANYRLGSIPDGALIYEAEMSFGAGAYFGIDIVAVFDRH